jgi:hypothetical protein
MNRQPDAKVLELVTQGERAANVRFAHSTEIVAVARGSFRLAQELCYQCAVAAGVDRVEAGAPRPIETLPSDARVRKATRVSLDRVFEDPVARFSKADRETRTPGACIALLWLLSIGVDGCVLIDAAAERYPALSAAFCWIQEDHLAEWLDAKENASVAALLAITAGELRAADPRFLYYLGVLDWKQVGKRARVDVLVPSESLGDLQIIPASYAGAGVTGRPDPASIAKRSLLEAPPPFPWWHPSASSLLSQLQGAYAAADAAFDVAGKVQGLQTGHVNRAQGIERVWHDLIDAAANQGKLGALVEVVLGDGSVAAYHSYIRAAVAPPGSQR